MDRFWAKVEKNGPLVCGMWSPCWVWTAGKFANGYGALNNSKKAKEKTTRYAHRISWEIHNGKIPDGMCVLHHCDNPPCVNPDHLFIGTQADNMADMRSKGRDSKAGLLTSHSVRGENNPRAKFTTAQVKAIKRLLAAGFGRQDVANVFNCPRSRIADIALNRCWTHINYGDTSK